MIRTTLNIHVDNLSKITETAERHDKSCRDIIIMLLMRLMRDLESYEHRFKTVTYQEDDVKENWHHFHICYREDENEYSVDLRKLTKFSVSCLLAIAVKKYLNDLIRDIQNKPMDNYVYFRHYVLHAGEIEGVISSSFYWGLPIDHLKTYIPFDN